MKKTFEKQAEEFIEEKYDKNDMIKHAECVYVDEKMAIIRDRSYGTEDTINYCPVYKDGKGVTDSPERRLIAQIYPLERMFNEAEMIEAVQIAEQARMDLLPIPTLVKEIRKDGDKIVVYPEFSWGWAADKNGIRKNDEKVKIEF